MTDEEVTRGRARALVERVARCRWLEPDAAMEALGAAERAWVEDRFDEHASALEAVADELPRGELAVTRSAVELWELWRSRWWGDDAARDPDRAALHVRALGGAPAWARKRRPEGAPEVPLWLHDGLRASLDRALAAAREASPRWGIGAAPALGEEAPAEALAKFELEWLELHHGMERVRPSPWAPLLALWERGLWAVSLPFHGLGVWVPSGDGDRLAWDPSRPGEGAPGREGEVFPHALLAYEARLRGMGVGTPPVRDVGLPEAWVEVDDGRGVVRHPVRSREVTVGRVAGNTVVIARANVSKRHCRISWERGRFWVVDLQSACGTVVNARRVVGAQPLDEGDVIRVGDARVRVVRGRR